VIDAARKSGKVDYDAKIEGLQALDRLTLQLKLTAVDYTVLEKLAVLTTYAVAREVVEAAGADIQSRPVGTGPFVLKEWRRGSRVVLEANPRYRTIAFPQSDDPKHAELARTMKGRKLPALSGIEVSIIEEQVPELLAFEQGALDYVTFTGTIVSRLLESGRIRPDLAARGVGHIRYTVPALIFTFFNQDDPLVGGNAPEKIALRRAIAMGFNNDGVHPRSLLAATRCRPRNCCRSASAGTTRRRRQSRRTIRPPLGRCSTGSATRTATATASASYRTASRWSWYSHRTPAA
jgi:ABC-type transport system substrate-binding protein